MKPQKAEALFGCLGPAGEARYQGYRAAGAMSVPVFDTGIFSVTTSVAAATNDVQTKECYLDAIIKNIAKAIVHEITSSIIEWINNGFEGSPTFVTNPEQFFFDIADQELGRMIDGSGLGFLCDPFKIEFQFAMISQRSRYRSPSRCTITGIIKNFQKFADTDFNSGGWPAFVSVSTRWENNGFGSYLNAQSHLESRVASRQNVAKIQLDWGKGFRSLLGKDGNIKTPGTLLEGQLENSLGHDIRDLELAKEFDDILGALVNYGISTIMKQGLGR